MTIDWITVTAQIINFLILVWLLQHFLYQPITNAMQRREEHIAERLEEAEKREQEADQRAQDYREKSERLEQDTEQIQQRAEREADRKKKELLNEAREEVSKTRSNWQTQVRDEKEDFLNNLRHQTTDTVAIVARKALGDLADSALEEQIVQSFIARLQSLDEKSRKSIVKEGEKVTISSAFELDSSVRGKLTRAVHKHLEEHLEVDYRQSPELLCGVELSSGGTSLGWNLANYLEAVDNTMADAFSPVEIEKEEA
ncbi:ATP synthase F0 subunit B [Kineobactrum sediminis]|uniref:ATP synthase subunit b n=1 Tax=Kineobactrum sediminis TaxID=1905677 RepID=A0A2N5Y217_9GAMM|nr:F0F1 ATP synthase subunit B [Kineobactrum sediminis]PLW82432.1 ATP synthase F0 subunit B [Kineobactrum sediminis]